MMEGWRSSWAGATVKKKEGACRNFREGGKVVLKKVCNIKKRGNKREKRKGGAEFMGGDPSKKGL